ncbi:FAD-dependent monooxygenase [Chloroflexi bacterium TSY]|nr:FAD-dependent monooxygenase [Chloroflexi bacterium TSY]
MMKRTEKILIVGGGIAGLAIARALQQRGWSPRLVEVQPTQPWARSGLYTPANGVAALEQLGLADVARSRSATIHRRLLATDQGRSVLVLDLEEVWGSDRYCLGIHRNVLQEILLESTREIDVALGTTITHIDANPDGVEVTLSDGTQDRFALVVGADGIRSSVRESILGKVPLRMVAPLTCRFITKRPAALDAWTLYANQAGQFLPFFITRLGLKFSGKKSWTEDYAPLREPLDLD